MLSDTHQQILAFEAMWTTNDGRKAERIHRHFGMTPARYYQILGAVLDDPDAVVGDPVVVYRLRKAREERISGRASRVLG